MWVFPALRHPRDFRVDLGGEMHIEHIAASRTITFPCSMVHARRSASRLDLPTPSGPIRPTIRRRIARLISQQQCNKGAKLLTLRVPAGSRANPRHSFHCGNTARASGQGCCFIQPYAVQLGRPVLNVLQVLRQQLRRDTRFDAEH